MKPLSIDGQLVPVCPHCEVPAKLAFTAWGPQWRCPVDGCDARVGVHKDSARFAPLGTLARAPLRALRHEVHEAFDPLWRRGMRPRFHSRSEAYAWLARQLDRPVARTHIGEFDEELCHAALAAIELDRLVPR